MREKYLFTRNAAREFHLCGLSGRAARQHRKFLKRMAHRSARRAWRQAGAVRYITAYDVT